MSIPDSIRKRPSVAAAVAGVMIVGAAIAIYVQCRDLGSWRRRRIFFSNDDGKTFSSTTPELPPFDPQRQAGVPRARVRVRRQACVGYFSATRRGAQAVGEANKYNGTASRRPTAPDASLGTT